VITASNNWWKQRRRSVPALVTSIASISNRLAVVIGGGKPFAVDVDK
jgi:hypothetical protein